MSTNAERGPVAGAPFENNTQVGCRAGSSEHATRRVPVASATSYPPAGRRRFTLLLVLH